MLQDVLNSGLFFALVQILTVTYVLCPEFVWFYMRIKVLEGKHAENQGGLVWCIVFLLNYWVLAPKQLLACYLTLMSFIQRRISYVYIAFENNLSLKNHCEACCTKRQSKCKPCRPYFGRVGSCCCASKQRLLQQAALLKEMPLKMEVKWSAWSGEKKRCTKRTAVYDEIAWEHWEQAKHKNYMPICFLSWEIP